MFDVSKSPIFDKVDLVPYNFDTLTSKAPILSWFFLDKAKALAL